MADHDAIPKPAYGTACNGCGGCCSFSLCTLAQGVFRRGAGGPCPALTFDDAGRSACGLVTEPQRHAPIVVAVSGARAASAAAALLVGTGLGCDGVLEGEVPDQAFSAFLRLHRRLNGPRFSKAMLIWRLGYLSHEPHSTAGV